MRKKAVLLGVLALCLTAVLLLGFVDPGVAYAATQTKNDYPVVLVHGFAGWGRDEVLGYKYWGGFTDLEKLMTNAGQKTYSAAVGPFSSNWDRACELYAYIMGGTVDYGAAHSAKEG
ncbi:MAG TPA: lipase, partial [Eubacteriales bacterium]|nr:lipase [Eubacteriales bacterium]